jgi:hypothetical protein
VLAAAFLFAAGSVMIYYGQLELRFGEHAEWFDRAVSMLAVGSLAFVPGSYAVVNLYGTWRGWEGYSYDAIPSYDE